MATGKQLKAAILARRAAPRKKRTRPEPRQYTVCTENSNTHVVMVKPAEDRI
jgi:hypothetical protein